MVRVRFAPSPTGPLHIGGVRTALYNYFFARKHHGVFILRIEDTDQQRYVPGAEEYIIESLTWCGIKFDEGPHLGGPYAPYKQSERKEIYRQYVDYLVQQGFAYYAFETPEELEELRKNYQERNLTFQYDCRTRKNLKNSLALPEKIWKTWINEGKPYVIRFKIPEHKNIIFEDLIRGKIEVSSNQLDDKVLFKSDGMPTYHLANVVDDHLMGITHVIRGEEWLPSAPLHVLMYEAFNWEMPAFAHLPLLLKPDGQGKLSKRDGDRLGFPVFPLAWRDPFTGEEIRGYREDGYLPDALVNFLALLGWNPGNDKELMSMEEMIELFSLDRISKSGAHFDLQKAKWFNKQYLNLKDNEELLPFLQNYYHQHHQLQLEPEILKIVISLMKERSDTLIDLAEKSLFFFKAPTTYNIKVFEKYVFQSYDEILLITINKLKETKWNESEIDQTLQTILKEYQISTGKFFNILRLAIVGDSYGPHLASILHLIGQAETISRIEKFIQNTKNKP
ncbi:MAG: glutamate--tRNA ligase [Bacteroidales bacterium]|nr:glutamate--tRNA ligase [Bacteroidales bacterium]